MNHFKTKILPLIFGVVICGGLSITANAKENTIITSPISYSSNEEKLAAPSGFKVKDTSAYTVTLSWKEVEGAVGYKIFMYNNSTGEFDEYKRIGNKTSYTVTGLEKGKEYKFQIAALTKYREKYIKTNTHSKEVSATTKKDVRNGWVTEGKEKYYYVDDTAVRSKTKKIDGKIYLFGKTGKLLTNGTYTINGSKYNVDKNGVVTCNTWLSTKKEKDSNTYYYATSSGKINEYTFVECDSVVDLTGKIPLVNFLYINGKLATSSDFSFVEDSSEYSGVCRMNKDYYYIGIAPSVAFVTKNLQNSKLSEYGSAEVIDLGSGKSLGAFYGKCSYNSKGCIISGTVYNTNDKYLYTFNGEGKSPVKSSAPPLMITESKTSVNSAGGVNWS